MKLSNFLYGLFGALIGFIMASTLALHKGWTELINFRKKNPTTPMAFYFATFAIIPVLLFIGFLGSPVIAGLAAYRCGKEESLQSIIDILTEPYIENSDENPVYSKLNTGLLMGYSSVLALTSFTLLNMVTGNFFGVLGVAGAALFSLFGISQSTLLGAFFGTLGLAYLGGATGGAIAAGHTLIVNKYYAPSTDGADDRPYFELREQIRQDSSAPVLEPLLSSPPAPEPANLHSQTTQPHTNRWKLRDTLRMDPLDNTDSESEEEQEETIYFADSGGNPSNS